MPLKLFFSPLLSVLHQISQLLGTGLDKESLAIVATLCESGVSADALAAVVKEFRREQQASNAIRKNVNNDISLLEEHHHQQQSLASSQSKLSSSSSSSSSVQPSTT
jgi:mitotic-spindle organizing protein 1